MDLGLFVKNIKISISEAMRMIDKNARGILFLVDDKERLVGSITDGDIRRFLLNGGDLMNSSVDAANLSPKTVKKKEDAKIIYHKVYCKVVPIVDDKNVIKDLYFGEEDEIYSKHKNLNIPVIINAGGRGTRLDPYTRVLPKPLIPIGDIPIIERIMNEYQSYNCNNFHIIVNYKRELIKAFFNDRDNDYSISWYDEKKPLGTGGGLSLLKGKIKETVFFVNCDVLLTADYEEIINFHKKNNNSITMICANKKIQIPYGVVETDENGIITNMQEKPTRYFLTNTGIYIIEPEIIEDIENDTCIDFPDIVNIEKRKGRRVAAYSIDENDWMDMGQLSELEKMRIKLYGE